MGSADNREMYTYVARTMSEYKPAYLHVMEGLGRSGTVDLCAFGRLYMSNPDLPERFSNNWPVEPECAYENWWYPTGAKGYTDYPFYKEEEKEEEKKEE